MRSGSTGHGRDRHRLAVRPGDLVLGDDDGIVVGREDEFAEALERATAIANCGADLRDAIQAGESLCSRLNLQSHVAALEAGRESTLTLG